MTDFPAGPGYGLARVAALVARMRAGLLRLADRLDNAILDERERWILWFPVAMGGGIAAWISHPHDPGILFWCLPLVLAGVIWLAGGGRIFATGLALLLVIAMAGAGMAAVRAHIVAAPVLQAETGPVTITGMVRDLDRRDDGIRIVLDDPEVTSLEPDETPDAVRIRLRRDDDGPEPGAVVSVRGVLMPLPGPAVAGGYSWARDAWFRGLGATGYAWGLHEVVAPPDTPASLRKFGRSVENLRQSVGARVLASLQGERGAVAIALLTGERGAVPDDVMEALRVSGIAHLLAISGLHIGLVAGAVFFAVRLGLVAAGWPGLHWPCKKIAALAALVAAAGYTVLVGAPVPTQRALLMTGVVLLAILVDRRAISMRLVALAALPVMILTPESVTGPSFQMSFAAVIALVAGWEYLRDRTGFVDGHRRGPPTIWRLMMIWVGGIMLTTLIASIATAPFALWHFGRLSVLGSVANLLAVPLTSLVVMPAGLLAVLLMPAGLEWLPLQIMGLGVAGVIATAEICASLPWAALRIAGMPAAAIILIVSGSLWLLLWQKPWRFAGMLPIIAGLVLTGAGAMKVPDMLVSDDGRAVAFYHAGGTLVFAGGRDYGFRPDAWANVTGAEIREKIGRNGAWPENGHATADADDDTPTGWFETGEMRAPYTACDAAGCTHITPSGLRLSILRRRDAVDDACRLPAKATTAQLPSWRQQHNALSHLVVVPWSLPQRFCPGAILVDGRVLRQGGGIAVTIDHAAISPTRARDERLQNQPVGPGPFHITTVTGQIDDRPWHRHLIRQGGLP